MGYALISMESGNILRFAVAIMTTCFIPEYQIYSE